MALDKAGLGDHLITGSRDTTCAIWKFTAIVRRTTTLYKIVHFNSCVVGCCFFFLQGIQKLPLQTLYGHDSEVGEIIVIRF